jgi:hypothetical protein
MKRGGGLESPVVYMILVVLSVLNLIAYISVRDYTAIFSFLIGGGFIYLMYPNKSIALFAAILIGAAFRTTYKEGLKVKKKLVKHPMGAQIKSKDKSVDLENNTIEGLVGATDKLMKNQQNLTDMTKQLGPMLKNATKLLDKLPDGFLNKAMEKFNNRK